MKLLIINGVNLGILGTREVNVYGHVTFEEYLFSLRQQFSSIQIDYFQSDALHELVARIHNAAEYDGIILNPGAYTHNSIVLADAVKAVATPVVEVHISNLFAREQYRRKSCLAGCCKGFISGFGLQGYALAVQSFIQN